MKLNSHHSNWVFSPQKPPPKSHEVNWRPTRDAVTRPGLFRGRSHISGTGKSNHNKRMFIRMVRLCTVIILPKKKTQKKSLPIRRRLFFHFPGSGSETSQVTFLVWPVWAPATPHPKVDQKPKALVAWSRWKLRPVSSVKRSAEHWATQPTCTGTFKSRPQHHS